MRKILLAITCSLAVAALTAQQLDQTIATVSYVTTGYKKTQAILLSKIKADIQAIEKSSGQKIPMDQRKQYVESKVIEALFSQMCEAEKLAVTDQELSQAVAYLGGGKLSEQEVYAEYAKQGVAMDEVKAMVRKQVLQLKWTQAKYAAKIKAITAPTEDEIFKAYDLMKSQLLRPDSVRIAMMVVENGTDAAKARTVADKVYQQVKGSTAKFNEFLFKGIDGKGEYKSIPESMIGKKPESIQALGQSFYDTVFKMAPKDIAGPIELKGKINGWAVVLLNDAFPQTELGLTDTLLPGQGKSIHDLLRDQLFQNKVLQETAVLFNADLADARKQYVKFLIALEKLDSVLNW